MPVASRRSTRVRDPLLRRSLPASIGKTVITLVDRRECATEIDLRSAAHESSEVDERRLPYDDLSLSRSTTIARRNQLRCSDFGLASDGGHDFKRGREERPASVRAIPNRLVHVARSKELTGFTHRSS